MFKKFDILLYGLVLGLFLFSLTIFIGGRNNQNIVEISVNGNIVETKNLQENCTIDIQGKAALQIENGSVRMLHSTCPDQICIKKGGIKIENDAIICIPNQIIIRIKEDKNALDSISY